MTLGTVEAGSDVTFTLTLNDQDGSPVDFKAGGDATFETYVERNGVVWILTADITTSIGADADGNPITVALADTSTDDLANGRHVVVVRATLSSGAKRTWRETFVIKRAAFV